MKNTKEMDRRHAEVLHRKREKIETLEALLKTAETTPYPERETMRQLKSRLHSLRAQLRVMAK